MVQWDLFMKHIILSLYVCFNTSNYFSLKLCSVSYQIFKFFPKFQLYYSVYSTIPIFEIIQKNFSWNFFILCLQTDLKIAANIFDENFMCCQNFTQVSKLNINW